MVLSEANASNATAASIKAWNGVATGFGGERLDAVFGGSGNQQTKLQNDATTHWFLTSQTAVHHSKRLDCGLGSLDETPGLVERWRAADKASGWEQNTCHLGAFEVSALRSLLARPSSGVPWSSDSSGLRRGGAVRTRRSFRSPGWHERGGRGALLSPAGGDVGTFVGRLVRESQLDKLLLYLFFSQ